VAVLALAAALSLVGSAASAVGIIGRIDGYNSDTVHLHAGHVVRVTLSPGRYGAFVGCADYIGCPQLGPRRLSVQGALSGAADVAASLGTDPDVRSEAGQPFVSELSFTIPAREQVQIALNANPGQPVFIALSEEEIHSLRGWIAVAIVSATVLVGSLAGLTWLLTRRARPGVA
jgi:hypothetical protein